MNTNHLKYFVTLAQTEHYGTAARELNITQPSLSKAIHSMEDELGIYLFERVGRGVRLTRAGKRYLEHASRALKELDKGAEILQRERFMSEGYLDIGIVSSISYNEFPVCIRDFEQTEKGKLYFSLHTDTSSQLLKDLCHDRYDLIFCTSIPEYNSQVEFVPVLEQPLACIIPEGHPLASRNQIDIHELDDVPLIIHTRDSMMQDITATLFQEAGIRLHPVAEATEDRTILGMVRIGKGLAIMTISPEVYGEGFQALPLVGTSFHRYISMGWRRYQARTEIAERFRKFVLARTAHIRMPHS